jgi:hypothetical protein
MSETHEYDEESVSLVPTRLTWEQRMEKARLQMIAADTQATSKLEEAVGGLLSVTGLTVLPVTGSKFAEVTEKAVVFTEDGEAFAAYTRAGINSVKLLLNALGAPPWPEPVALVVVTRPTRNGPVAYLTWPQNELLEAEAESRGLTAPA